MKRCYYNYDERTNEKIPSIFLAGPTDRSKPTVWRQEALDLLYNFHVNVYVPENKPYCLSSNSYLRYENIVDWEHDCLTHSSAILFWVPRSLDLPGFTTNV